MSEVLDPTGEFEDARRLYPWGEWFDGRPHRLHPSTDQDPGDFDPDPRVLRTYIYAKARERGQKVVITIEPDDCIVLQAYDPEARRPKLPSPYRRLANGTLDRTAPTGDTERVGYLPDCQVCGKRLTPAAGETGVCHKFNRVTMRPEPVHQ